MSRKLTVNKIYPAFMGEVNKYGIGVKCSFLRLAGCNIRCYKTTMGHLCDTPESLEGTDGTPMEIEEILDEIKWLDNKVICLTGGEPLLNKPLELLERLSEEGFLIVIETNGTMEIDNYRHIENVSFIVDHKAISTGESGRFRNSIIPLLRKDDYLKFVINDWADYKQMVKAYRELKEGSYPIINFAAGVFWGSDITYQDLMAQIIKDRLDIYLNMQNHKMAVLYDEYKDVAKDIFIPRNL